MNDRPHLQPCRYKDDKAIVQKLRELHAAKKLDDLTEKLLFAEKRPAEELYDLAADPHEVNNLADDPKHEATLDAMRKKLADWEERHRRQGPQARADGDVRLGHEGLPRRREEGQRRAEAEHRTQQEVGGARASDSRRFLLPDREADGDAVTRILLALVAALRVSAPSPGRPTGRTSSSCSPTTSGTTP